MVALPALPAHAATFGAYTVTSFAATGSESHPDDVTRLGDYIYVTYQNGVGPDGAVAPSGATASTIQQYRLDGTPGASWQVTGKVDGLTADPAGNRLLVTTNEDANSSFHTLTPGAATPLVNYTYVGLNHGGGTDAISILNGTILVSASAPATVGGANAATYSVQLSGTNANLTQVIADDSTATAINGPKAGTSVPLALSDPDSNLVVPASVPAYGGDFLLDGQADQQLIFSASTGAPNQSLTVLSVTQPLDDTVFATTAAPVLWVTDPSHNTLDRATGPFAPGEVVTSVAPNAGPTYLATVNLSTGAVAPITDLSSINPKGLLFTTAAVAAPVPAAPATPVTGSASFTG